VSSCGNGFSLIFFYGISNGLGDCGTICHSALYSRKHLDQSVSQHEGNLLLSILVGICQSQSFSSGGSHFS
jgi:hypothetical protein